MPVWRDARKFVRRRVEGLGVQRFPCVQRLRALFTRSRRGWPPNVDQRSCVGDAELRRSSRGSSRTPHTLHDWDRPWRYLQPFGIEWNGKQHTAASVDDVSSRQVTRIASTFDERLLFAFSVRTHQLRQVPSIRPAVAGKREKDRLSILQHLRPVREFVSLYTDQKIRLAPIR